MSTFDPEKLLRALSRRRVRYILVGATAARLQGFPRVTVDADISPASDIANVQRLSRALQDLRARVYTDSVPEGLPFSCDPETLSRANRWNLTTDGGRLDVVFKPIGTQGYEDLDKSAVTYRVFGIKVRAASLKDILRSKLASNRPQDQQDAIILEEMLRQR